MARETERAIWATPRGATWCAGAFAAGGGGAVALVGHITDGGEQRVIALALDAQGVRRADVDELTLPETSAYLATAVLDGERTLLAFAREDREERHSGDQLLQHYRPYFVDVGSGAWEPRVLTSRDDLDVAWMAAAAHGRDTAWLMRLVSWTDAKPSSHLGYGYANGAAAPEMRPTDIPCSTLAHLCTDRGALALVATKRQADLWMLDRSGAPQKVVGEIAVANNRREISKVRIAQLRDGFVFVWYVTPNGSYDNGGGLYARTASADLSDVGPVQRVARVDEAGWSEWRADDVRDGALVLFGSGSAGDRLKQLRVRVRADLEQEARAIPGKLPVALAVTCDGAVAITEKVAAGGRKTTLLSRLHPIT